MTSSDPYAPGLVALQRLAAIVDSSPAAILSVGADGCIASWNRGASVVFGHSRDSAIGRPVIDLAAPRDESTLAALVARGAAGQLATERHTVCRTSSGGEVEVALTVSPLGAGEVAVFARDVTEERWLAATLDRSLDSLRRALDDAREAEAAARRFLADVAHQLRTPVAGIKASAEVLLSGGELPPEMHDRLLANIVSETTRAGRLMSSLVRMARLEQGEELVREPTDVGATCDAAAETARVLAPHLTISVDASGVAGLRPLVDPHALEEILGNLLDNARRYAKHQVTVTVVGVPDAVEIRVADDGPGLPAGREDEAFERFVRLDGRGGSGLGLAIARSLARAHGGDLSWSGADFVVRLGG